MDLKLFRLDVVHTIKRSVNSRKKGNSLNKERKAREDFLEKIPINLTLKV